jgi:transcriptional regulator with PAS, ATPase and Fis domain
MALIVGFFAQKYARRMDKRIQSILAALSKYHWPGNIPTLIRFIKAQPLPTSN